MMIRLLAVFFLLCLLAPLAAVDAEAESNPLLGRWERETTPGWIGFRWIEFTADSMRNDLTREIAVERYDITAERVRVRTRLGESYVFELVGPDRICLPEARLWALTGRGDAAGGSDRLCYARAA